MVKTERKHPCWRGIQAVIGCRIDIIPSAELIQWCFLKYVDMNSLHILWNGNDIRLIEIPRFAKETEERNAPYWLLGKSVTDILYNATYSNFITNYRWLRTNMEVHVLHITITMRKYEWQIHIHCQVIWIILYTSILQAQFGTYKYIHMLFLFDIAVFFIYIYTFRRYGTRSGKNILQITHHIEQYHIVLNMSDCNPKVQKGDPTRIHDLRDAGI